MNGAIGWFARNPVAANLLMVLIAVSGLMAAATVTEEVFPEIDLRRIRIEVPYLGAAPEEVESGVVVRIEEAIQNIDGVQQIVSTASEGSASVIAELEFGADSQRVPRRGDEQRPGDHHVSRPRPRSRSSARWSPAARSPTSPLPAPPTSPR